MTDEASVANDGGATAHYLTIRLVGNAFNTSANATPTVVS